MSTLSKKSFQEKLRIFRVTSVGAACFTDSQGKPFCANNLTREQADEFAELHNLTLTGFNLGKSCTQINC